MAKDWRQCIDLCWPAGLLPVFLIFVQPWPKTAGQCIDLCWPACLLSLFLILVQPWLKIVRPMCRSMLTGQCIDLCRLACLLPVSLILVSLTMAQNRPANVPIYVDRPVFRQYFCYWSNRPRTAGRQS